MKRSSIEKSSEVVREWRLCQARVVKVSVVDYRHWNAGECKSIREPTFTPLITDLTRPVRRGSGHRAIGLADDVPLSNLPWVMIGFIEMYRMSETLHTMTEAVLGKVSASNTR